MLIKKSSALERMLSEERGYRTESYSGSGIRDVEEILRYEIGELGNTDILAYIRDNYGCLQDFNISEDIMESLKREALNEEELQLLIFEEEQNLAIENQDYFIEKVIDFLKDKFKEEVVGLWFTSFNGVVEKYGGKIGDIDCYEIPQEAFVISDLGEDGVLFVFPKRLLKRIEHF